MKISLITCLIHCSLTSFYCSAITQCVCADVPFEYLLQLIPVNLPVYVKSTAFWSDGPGTGTVLSLQWLEHWEISDRGTVPFFFYPFLQPQSPPWASKTSLCWDQVSSPGFGLKEGMYQMGHLGQTLPALINHLSSQDLAEMILLEWDRVVLFLVIDLGDHQEESPRGLCEVFVELLYKWEDK